MPSKAKASKETEPKKEETKKTVSKTEQKKTETKKTDSKKSDRKVESKKAPEKKSAAKKPAKKQQKVVGEEEEKKKRSFKAIYTNSDGEVVMQGRYCGAKPKQAACKALTGICKLFAKNQAELDGEIYFAVRETTRKSRNKIYFYSGQRLVLEEPITLEIKGGKEITYKYNNIVKKANADNCTHLLNYKEVEEEEAKPVKQEKKSEKKTSTKDTKKVATKSEKKPVKKDTKDTKKKPVKKQ